MQATALQAGSGTPDWKMTGVPNHGRPMIWYIQVDSQVVLVMVTCLEAPVLDGDTCVSRWASPFTKFAAAQIDLMTAEYMSTRWQRFGGAGVSRVVLVQVLMSWFRAACAPHGESITDPVPENHLFALGASPPGTLDIVDYRRDGDQLGDSLVFSQLIESCAISLLVCS